MPMTKCTKYYILTKCFFKLCLQCNQSQQVLVYHRVMPELFSEQFQETARQIQPASEPLAAPTTENMHIPFLADRYPLASY